MANVFISYNRQSESIVRTLVSDIESLNNTVWFDQELSGGQVWWDQIMAKIRNCDVFVFVVTPESLNSEACKREYSYADDLGKPILPILVADGVSTNLLPSALSQIQFVDYRQQDRSSAFRLARAFATIPAPKPLPNPPPPPPQAPISYLGTLTERIETTDTLSYEEQDSLLLNLKRGWREPRIKNDVRTLLTKFRKRRDLFVVIAEEIDELLVGRIKIDTVNDE
ncbi:MAG: toll/interleukin-1 receptor domain-containing protein, partial [Cyanobacteria bacterium P01_F01_bin.143]